MLHPDTLNEIRESHLKCVEYEIGLFLCLLTNPDEIEAVINAASTREDYKKILGIANNANKEAILNILSYAGMSLLDVSFESSKYTQRGDFARYSKIAYMKSWNNGWLDEFFPEKK